MNYASNTGNTQGGEDTYLEKIAMWGRDIKLSNHDTGGRASEVVENHFPSLKFLETVKSKSRIPLEQQF